MSLACAVGVEAETGRGIWADHWQDLWLILSAFHFACCFAYRFFAKQSEFPKFSSSHFSWQSWSDLDIGPFTQVTGSEWTPVTHKSSEAQVLSPASDYLPKNPSPKYIVYTLRLEINPSIPKIYTSQRTSWNRRMEPWSSEVWLLRPVPVWQKPDASSNSDAWRGYVGKVTHLSCKWSICHTSVMFRCVSSVSCVSFDV